jgi:hypothetical protein
LRTRLFRAPPQLVKVARNSGVSRTTVSSGVAGLTGTAGGGATGAAAWAAACGPDGAAAPGATLAASGPALPFFGMKNSFHAKRMRTEPRAANMMRLLSFTTYLPSSSR